MSRLRRACTPRWSAFWHARVSPPGRARATSGEADAALALFADEAKWMALTGETVVGKEQIQCGLGGKTGYSIAEHGSGVLKK